MHFNKREAVRKALKHGCFVDQIPQIAFDHMPTEVATEMLCAPKARMTNRERKECQRAREIRYASPRQPRTTEQHMQHSFT